MGPRRAPGAVSWFQRSLSAGDVELSSVMLPVYNEKIVPAVDQFLKDEHLRASTEQLLADPKRQRLSALCFIEHAGSVLMLQRKQPPFEGHWTAPGGKLKPGEDPRIAIAREVREETGLLLHRPRLRVIASETGSEHYNWLLFLFRAEPVTEGVAAHLLRGPRDSDEGSLNWLPVADLMQHRLPGVERLLLPYIFADDDGAPQFARIRFDEDHNVADMDLQRMQRRE